MQNATSQLSRLKSRKNSRMSIGKKEKIAIFDWLLQKHGMRRRLVHAKCAGRRLWHFGAVSRTLDNSMHSFVAYRDDGEPVGLGIDNPCCGKHKVLDCLLKWNTAHRNGIYLSPYKTDLFIKPGETLESLMMQYELENSH